MTPARKPLNLRRRIPPKQFCQDPMCGFEWRSYASTCPKCASRERGPQEESLRAFRRRLQSKDDAA